MAGGRATPPSRSATPEADYRAPLLQDTDAADAGGGPVAGPGGGPSTLPGGGERSLGDLPPGSPLLPPSDVCEVEDVLLPAHLPPGLPASFADGFLAAFLPRSLMTPGARRTTGLVIVSAMVGRGSSRGMGTSYAH